MEIVKINEKTMQGEDLYHQRSSVLPLALALCAGQLGFMLLTVIAPIKNELSIEWNIHTGMSFSKFEYFYGLMYTSYGAPNFFMPLVAGVVIDCIGATKVVMLCSLLNVIGGVLQGLGILFLQLPVLLCGRFFLGLGNESLYVAVVALLGEFLTDGEISKMNGILCSGVMVGTAFGNLLAVPVLEMVGKYGLCVFMVAVAFVQLFANLVVLRQRDRSIAAEKTLAIANVNCDELWPLVKSEMGIKEVSEEESSQCEQTTIRGTAIYAALVFCSAVNTIGVWNFSMILCPLLLEIWPPRFGESVFAAEERAGAWSFFFMLVPALGSSLAGGAAAAVGCPGLFILLSNIVLTVGLGILSLAAHHDSPMFFIGPLLPLLLVAASNALMTPLLYQCIKLTMPTKHHAKAMGLLSVMQNVAMGIWPLLIAHLRVISGSYQSGTIAFAATGFLGLACWLLMLFLDGPSLGGSNTLSKPSPYLVELVGHQNKGI